MSRALLKSTSIVGFFTLISRVLGLARDIVFATFLVIGPAMDAFFVAFKIPNYLRRLFAEGAFSQAFVPVISEYRQRQDEAAVKSLVDRVAGTFGGVLLLITTVGMLAAPWIVTVFAYGFRDDPAQFMLTTELLRITFPYLLFISLTAFAGGILNTYGRFAAPALAPVLLNLCLIAGALHGARGVAQPVEALAWGVFAAGVLQLLLQLPWLLQLRLLPRPRWDRAHAGVRKIFRLMLPALFGSSVAQLNLLIDVLIASFLATGSISWLYYADRLMEFPLGVFTIALGTVILPKLSSQHSGQDGDGFSATLDFALRLLLLIILPAAVGLLVLSGPIVVTIFDHGVFRANDVLMTRTALMAYTVGLLGFSMVKILAPGYFARQDTRTPVRIGMVAVIVNIVLNFVFVGLILHFGFAAPHAGLALATGVAALVNALLLYRGLIAGGHFRAAAGWLAFAGRIVIATLAMALVASWLGGELNDWLAMSLLEQVIRLSGIILASLIVYLLALLACGFRPRQLKAAITRATPV